MFGPSMYEAIKFNCIIRSLDEWKMTKNSNNIQFETIAALSIDPYENSESFSASLLVNKKEAPNDDLNEDPLSNHQPHIHLVHATSRIATISTTSQYFPPPSSMKTRTAFYSVRKAPLLSQKTRKCFPSTPHDESPLENLGTEHNMDQPAPTKIATVEFPKNIFFAMNHNYPIILKSQNILCKTIMIKNVYQII